MPEEKTVNKKYMFWGVTITTANIILMLLIAFKVIEDTFSYPVLSIVFFTQLLNLGISASSDSNKTFAFSLITYILFVIYLGVKTFKMILT